MLKSLGNGVSGRNHADFGTVRPFQEACGQRVSLSRVLPRDAPWRKQQPDDYIRTATPMPNGANWWHLVVFSEFGVPLLNWPQRSVNRKASELTDCADSQDDSQAGRRYWTSADARGIQTPRAELRRPVMDEQGKLDPRSSKPFAGRCEASWVGSIPIHPRHSFWKASSKVS